MEHCGTFGTINIINDLWTYVNKLLSPSASASTYETIIKGKAMKTKAKKKPTEVGYPTNYLLIIFVSLGMLGLRTPYIEPSQNQPLSISRHPQSIS